MFVRTVCIHTREKILAVQLNKIVKFGEEYQINLMVNIGSSINFFIMKLFHGKASINGLVYKKGELHVTSISLSNLREKAVILPKKFVNLLKRKLSYWLNDIAGLEIPWMHRDGPYIERINEVMFTVAMNDKFMVITIQHPSDTGKKKSGYKKALNRLKKATKGEYYPRYSSWVVKLP